MQETGSIPLVRNVARGLAGRNKPPLVIGYALVDPIDYARLNVHVWLMSSRGYAIRYEPTPPGAPRRQRLIHMHREILALSDHGLQADHRNRNPLDNRRSNLRPVTAQQNRQNRSKYRGATSRFRGVYWDAQHSRWRAQVDVNGTRIRLGRFVDEAEAGEAARAARIQYLPFTVEESPSPHERS